MPFPAGLTLVTVHCQFDTLPSGGASGTVQFTAPEPLVGAADNSIVPPFTAAGVLDASGGCTVQLPATNDPQWTPTGWAYAVLVNITGGPIRGTLQLDYQTTSVELADLLQVDGAAETGTTYIPLSQRSTASGVAGLDADGDVIDAAGNKVGGSGAINETIVNAKGDLIAATAADTVARLPVGTDGQYLKAASGQATGLQWDTFTATDISDSTATGRAVVTAADAAAARTAIDAQQADSDLTTIAGLTATTDNMIQSVGSAWASRTPAQVKTALALNNLDNTSDANKPVSTAAQTALNAKMAITGGAGFTLANGGVVAEAGGSRMDAGFSGTVEGAGLELYKDDHSTRPGGASFVYGAGAPGVGAVRFIHYDGTDYYVRAEYLPDGGVKIYNSTAPATPSGGAVLYAEGGVPKCIDASGTISTIGAGGSTLVVKRAIVTSGNLTPQNTSSAWQALTGGPTLVIPAAAGDYISAEVMGMLIDPASTTFIELAVLAGASLVRYGSTGTGTPAVEGDPALYPDTVNFSPTGPPVMDFVAQAGDISGGSITICLAVNSAGGGTIYASTAFPLRWRVLNHGAATVS